MLRASQQRLHPWHHRAHHTAHHTAKLAAALGAAFAISSGCSANVQNQTTGTGGSGGDGGQGGSISSSTTSSSSSSSSGVPGTCIHAEDCPPTGNPCTLPTCINGMCSPLPANDYASCDDGQFCTENDFCLSGVCNGGTAKFCPPLDACHIGVCDEGLDTCKNVPGNDGAQCNDGNSCTGPGECMSGACVTGNPVDCSVFDGQCTAGVCDPVVGCKPAPANEGGPCDDGQASPCSAGMCVAGACASVPANEGGPCDDNLFCTIGDHCQAGACVPSGPNPCAPPGGCYIASCDEAQHLCTAVPGNDGSPCDDGNTCTANTTCLNGACIGGVPANEGAPCDDGSTCTSNTLCIQGQCAGGQGPTVYFSDDFKDNSKGWVLDTEWQIGPAQASFGQVYGNPDPSVDHTPTADNGVAGVVIGGNASTAGTHAYRYMSSPPFNTSNAAGQVIFGYYRWLNSDYDPFMHNAVDVWDGSTWVNLWTSGSSPGVQDLAWTFVSFDVTAYKNAGMRVRFGFDIGSSGVYTVSSWNVDDVLVASAACP